MATSDYTATILVDQTPEETFAAINNVSEWWTGEPGVKGSTDQLNDEFTYEYLPYHYTKQKVTELVPGKKIVWLVTESNINFVEDKNEWTGTEIIFEIEKKRDKTEIRFTHVGLTPDVECYDNCSNGWNAYITGSLHQFLVEGKGVEFKF